MKIKIILCTILLINMFSSVALANLWIHPYTEIYEYEGKMKQEVMSESDWTDLSEMKALMRLYSKDNNGEAGEIVYYTEAGKIYMYSSFIKFNSEKNVINLYSFLKKHLEDELGKPAKEEGTYCIWKTNGLVVSVVIENNFVTMYTIKSNE